MVHSTLVEPGNIAAAVGGAEFTGRPIVMW